MKTRIISASVILPVAIAVLVFLPPWVLAVTLAAICAAAAYELFTAVNGTCKKTPSPRAAVYAMICAAMVPFAVYFFYLVNLSIYYSLLVIFFIIFCLVLIDFFLSLKSEKRIRLRQLLITPVAVFVIPLMLSALVGLRVLGGDMAVVSGQWLVLLPVIATVMTDSGAYFIGKAIGKRKPLPKISPNKTVEGFIGGIAAGVLGMLLYGLIMDFAAGYAVSYPLLLVYGAVGAVVTEIGDLAFSLVKRKCGIKDYGKLIPGHGGILDRLDSLCFCAPCMLLLVMTLQAIG